MTTTTEHTTAATEIRPLTIDVQQHDIDDLRDRLARTRFIEEVTVPPGTQQTGWLPPKYDHGTPASYIREAVDFWLHSHDWRATEARLNAFDNHRTLIDGVDLHFIHQRSPRPDAVPLLLMHGWPNSVLEYLDLIPELVDPKDASVPAFHVVVPSLPGFGFSGPTTERGWNRFRMADAFAELMSRLGYHRYLVHGNDVGAEIAPEFGRRHPDHVIGAHITQIFSFPTGAPGELDGATEEELAQVRFLENWNANHSAYATLQRTAPHQLAHALIDSPTGQLAWSGQLLQGTGLQHLVDNATLTWLTRTAASSARRYYEDANAPSPAGPTTIPLGLAAFAFDVQPLRRFAERDHANIIYWRQHDRGSHWAAQDAPDLLVQSLRDFATLTTNGASS